MIPFRYIEHFRVKGHSNSVIIGPFVPYVYKKYFGVLLVGSLLKNGNIGFKEE